jgi:hypothetical protein
LCQTGDIHLIGARHADIAVDGPARQQRGAGGDGEIAGDRALIGEPALLEIDIPVDGVVYEFIAAAEDEGGAAIDTEQPARERAVGAAASALFWRPMVPPVRTPLPLSEMFQSGTVSSSGPVCAAEMVPEVLFGRVCACAVRAGRIQAAKGSSATPASRTRRRLRRPAATLTGLVFICTSCTKYPSF